MGVKADAGTFDELVLRAEGQVLAEFYSDGCSACRMLSPVLGELEDGGEVKVVKINVGVSADLAERYSVAAAPTLILFSGGEEQWRQTGFIEQTELETALRERR